MKTEREECSIFNWEGKAKTNSIGALLLIKKSDLSFVSCMISLELLLMCFVMWFSAQEPSPKMSTPLQLLNNINCSQ